MLVRHLSTAELTAVVLGLAARWVVSGVLFAAGASKLLQSKHAPRSAYALPRRTFLDPLTKPLFLRGLGLIEVILSSGIMLGIEFRFCSVTASALLVGFTSFLTIVKQQGYEGPCLCFGDSAGKVGYIHIGRAGALAALAALAGSLARSGAGDRMWTLPGEMVLGSGATAALLVVFGATIYYAGSVRHLSHGV